MGFRVSRAVEVQPVAVVPDLDIAGAVEVKWTSQAGVSYQPQYSADGASWLDIGSPVEGTGNEIRLLQPIGERERLFRVRVNPECGRPAGEGRVQPDYEGENLMDFGEFGSTTVENRPLETSKSP